MNRQGCRAPTVSQASSDARKGYMAAWARMDGKVMRTLLVILLLLLLLLLLVILTAWLIDDGGCKANRRLGVGWMGC